MGPSGSGKSTLLTIAGTLEEATAGEVLIDGTPVGAMRSAQRAQLRRRSLGFVFQDFNLLAGLTAAENVSMPLELDGMRAPRCPRRGGHGPGHLGVDDLADRFPTTCPEASGSGWPSPAPSSASGRCCWRTSPRARSTR
jgi:putative ABC transport system ATP-binding protein